MEKENNLMIHRQVTVVNHLEEEIYQANPLNAQRT